MRTLSLYLSVAVLSSLFAGCGVQTAEQDQRFSIDGPVHRVVVTSDAGAVDIVGEAREGAQLEAYSSYSRTAPEITTQVSNGTLRVDVRCASQARCSSDLTLWVPVQVDVDVETGAGPVSVSDVDGEVVAFTGAGSVDGVGLVSNRVVADTGSGPITLELLSPPSRLVARTDAGPVDLVVPSQSYDLDLETRVGPVEVDGVWSDAQATGLIRASTGSGSVAVHGI
ncbi:MAG: DUF4097 and DUF4098 domain-containing protein YvlB [Myxococcota bacterium]|jgi:DUF4097 and DUF4098 domain-containing protein YvlB